MILDPNRPDIQMIGILNNGLYLGQDEEGYMYECYKQPGHPVHWTPMLTVEMKHWRISREPPEGESG